MHHAVADGIGGLAALAELVDVATTGAQPPFPRLAPNRRALLRDIMAARLRMLGSLPAAARIIRAGVAELAGNRIQLSGGERRRLPRTSLNRPIGPRRHLAIVRIPIKAAVDVAHRH